MYAMCQIGFTVSFESTHTNNISFGSNHTQTTHNTQHTHTTHNTHTKLFRTQNEATQIYLSIDEATQNTMAGGVSRQSSDTILQQYPNCEPGNLRGAGCWGCWVLGAGLRRFLSTMIYLGPPDTQHTAHSTQHTTTYFHMAMV
jgi:hypothetical protein